MTTSYSLCPQLAVIPEGGLIMSQEALEGGSSLTPGSRTKAHEAIKSGLEDHGKYQYKEYKLCCCIVLVF